MKTLLEQENLEPRVDKAGGAANNDSNDFFKIFSKHMDAIMLKVSSYVIVGGSDGFVMDNIRKSEASQKKD